MTVIENFTITVDGMNTETYEAVKVIGISVKQQ